MERNPRQIIISVIRIIAVVLAVLIVGFASFTLFRIHTEASSSLRQAKNILFAMKSVDIEFYGKNTTVFDASQPDGIREGTKPEVELLNAAKYPGHYAITSYDVKKRIIKGFIYINGRYQVSYSYRDKDTDRWKVDYTFTVLDYDDAED
ncbi:MAG: hypothetical protein MR799_08765 [Lachnospiraceae bacterium]|nr:hypothetical protein [Lachnospiraceae bacterium]